jgi:hypothetical protein
LWAAQDDTNVIRSSAKEKAVEAEAHITKTNRWMNVPSSGSFFFEDIIT